MSPGPACDAQIVQATRNGDVGIGKSISGVAELVLGNATDLDVCNRIPASFGSIFLPVWERAP
jgi:hypothetical protein